ncbi:DUF350 domain-containing protein [Candidatus Micrarchaeota archaeon]|nr:DUF350 domain-containing protein [Candidatus Micrarchaeota archaeon]
MAQEILANFVLGLVRILIAMVFSAFTIYSSLKLFDSLTKGIEEWEEIKKGNLSVGVFFVAIVVSVFMIMLPRIDMLLVLVADQYTNGISAAVILFVGLLNFLLTLGISTFLIFISLTLVDRLTPTLDELAELKRGNVAVGIVLAITLVLMTIAMKDQVLNTFDLFSLLGPIIRNVA